MVGNLHIYCSVFALDTHKVLKLIFKMLNQSALVSHSSPIFVVLYGFICSMNHSNVSFWYFHNGAKEKQYGLGRSVSYPFPDIVRRFMVNITFHNNITSQKKTNKRQIKIIRERKTYGDEDSTHTKHDS